MGYRNLKKSPELQEEVISGFGDEWARLPQDRLSEVERRQLFQDYFSVFPWERLPKGGGIGADIGCGSGRWADLVAPTVKLLHLVDASAQALEVARTNLARHANVRFHCASIDSLPFARGSLDFAYCLGVLHVVPDSAAAIKAISNTLKPSAPFLLYLYYNFENRPFWYRVIWRLSSLLRFGICRLPYSLRYAVTQTIALCVYWPIARLGRFLELVHSCPEVWPLSYYRDKSFYVMRTDALDRFGTRLERRFSRSQIRSMLTEAGFHEITFSNRPPYWCVVGIKGG